LELLHLVGGPERKEQLEGQQVHHGGPKKPDQGHFHHKVVLAEYLGLRIHL
jgi:hypothetical protein